MNQTTPKLHLHSARHDNCTPEALLAAVCALLAEDERAIGWAATPQHWRFIAADGGALQHPEGVDTDQLIELRLVTLRHDWRWLRDPARSGITGTGVCLCEPDHLPDGWTVLSTLDKLSALDSQRLLTGTLGAEDPPMPGWGWMHAPRHGRVALPLTGQHTGRRIAWRVREYIGPAPGEAGRMGNRCVVEERLLGLAPGRPGCPRRCRYQTREHVMAEFLNPYNFIPTPPRAATHPELGDHPPPGHHRWHADRYSGRLTVRLTTVTPLLIPDGGREMNNGHKVFGIRTSADGRPLLPPTSVKGMLRGAYEAVTHSRFGVFTGHEERLAFRAPSNSAISLVPCRIIQVEHRGTGAKHLAARLLNGRSTIGRSGRPGGEEPALMYAAWLRRYRVGGHLEHDKGQQQQALRYADRNLPSHGDKVWVQVQEIKHRSNRFRFLQVTAIRREPPPANATDWLEGWVCITGANIANKHDERVFLVGDQSSRPILLEDGHRRQWSELIANYQDLHKDEVQERQRQNLAPSDYLGHEPGQTAFSRHVYVKDDLTLKAGTLCYAAVRSSENATAPWQIKALYPVSISRDLFEQPPIRLLDDSLRPADALERLSPADRVFGWVNAAGHGQFKGQLRVGPVRCEHRGEQAIERFGGDGVPLAILGSPKPQQGRFYTSPDSNNCKPHPQGTSKAQTYQQGQALRGRKVYLHPAHLSALDESQRRAYWQDNGGHVEPVARLQNGQQLYREWLQLGEGQARRSNQNRSVTAWVRPGTPFTFDIEVSNLSAMELGALLWLLKLPVDCHHRLGGGKPLGLGSVRLELTGHRLHRGDALRQRYATLADEAAVLNDSTIDDIAKSFGECAELQAQIRAFSAAAKGWKSLPTHYPRSEEPPSAEGQSFKWFVANEAIRNGQVQHGYALPKLTGEAIPKLPVLDANRSGPNHRGPANHTGRPARR